MMRLTAILFGLLLLSSSVQAKKVYSETDYRPPDYDVGHPELITEAKVLLTEKVSREEQKVAKVQLSTQTLILINRQIESLLPDTPSPFPGEGQTTNMPKETWTTKLWESTFEEEGPLFKLQVTLEELDIKFDQLTLKDVAKYNKLVTGKRSVYTNVHFESGHSLKGNLVIFGNNAISLSIKEGDIWWQIKQDTTDPSLGYFLYKSTIKVCCNDSIDYRAIIPTEPHQFEDINNISAIPETIGQNPHRIDIYFIYEPGFNKTTIDAQGRAGVKKFNDLLTNASDPSSFYINYLGYGPAPALTCQPHNEPCNNLHSFDEVLEAMRESSAMTQLRRQSHINADLIVVFRTNIEIGDLGDPDYQSEWTIYGKAYTPPSPANAKNFKWSIGAISGNKQ